MLSNWSKSISTILYERLTSPWWGTLVIAWSVVNWRIIYLTVFVSSNEIEGNKIDYIITNYSDPWHIYGWPIIITIGLVGAFPFLEYYLYWLHLWFKERKYKKQIDVEKKQVLDVGKAAKLRQDMADITSNFNRIIDDKDREIKIRDTQISELQNELSRYESERERRESDEIMNRYFGDENPSFSEQEQYYQEFEQLKKTPKIWTSLKAVLSAIVNNFSMPSGVSADIRHYHLVNDIVIESKPGKFELTTKGKYFYKKLLEGEFSKSGNDSDTAEQ